MMRIILCFLLTALTAWAQLEGVIDLHVHAAPDSRPRSITAMEVARIARRQGMRALLFKDHYTQTASTAYLVHQEVPGIEVYGGIALNASVGGINPIAVENMAKMAGGLGRVVWMPTFDSEHGHLTGRPNPNHVPVSSKGELLPKVIEVLDVIARENLALATGHSSPAESLLLIREAKKRGINRIIVTHPLLQAVGMTIAQQKEAAQMGAFIEHPYNVMIEGRAGADAIIKAIREVGPEHCILTSDLGQPGNPIHPDGLLFFFQRLRQQGITQQEIDLMSKTNPARFLGLD
jgi:hypothetical protein